MLTLQGFQSNASGLELLARSLNSGLVWRLTEDGARSQWKKTLLATNY
jgi:hypothetical protein